jgi:hypothetical protein
MSENLSTRAARLLKDEQRLREAVGKLIDDYVNPDRGHGVPKSLVIACEFARFKGSVVGILEHIRDSTPEAAHGH